MPALGRPTRPASAISFRRSQIQRSSPSRPGLAWRGAWLVEVLKWALPKPPLPPSASTTRSPSCVEVGDQRLVVLLEDLGADRHLAARSSSPLAPGRSLAHAVAAGLGLEVLLVAVVDQRVEAVDRLDDDVAAAAAVAAVRAAELDELLAPERDAAGAAVAGADVDLGLVEEFHGSQIAFSSEKRSVSRQENASKHRFGTWGAVLRPR